jgi:hypothetical protein
METAEKTKHFENSKMDNLKNEKISRFDQPLFRAKLTVDRIWLANYPCCAIGIPHQVVNFDCISIVTSSDKQRLLRTCLRAVAKGGTALQEVLWEVYDTSNEWRTVIGKYRQIERER